MHSWKDNSLLTHTTFNLSSFMYFNPCTQKINKIKGSVPFLPHNTPKGLVYQCTRAAIYQLLAWWVRLSLVIVRCIWFGSNGMYPTLFPPSFCVGSLVIIKVKKDNHSANRIYDVAFLFFKSCLFICQTQTHFDPTPLRPTHYFLTQHAF